MMLGFSPGARAKAQFLLFIDPQAEAWGYVKNEKVNGMQGAGWKSCLITEILPVGLGIAILNCFSLHEIFVPRKKYFTKILRNQIIALIFATR